MRILRATLLCLFLAGPLSTQVIPCCIIAIGGGSGGGGISALTGDVVASGTGSVPATVVSVQGVIFPGTAQLNSVPVVTTGPPSPFIVSYMALPNCGDTTHALSFNTTTHSFGCQALSGGGGGGAPGGFSGQFQFNNSGSFGGVSDLTYSGRVITLTAGATLDTHLGTFFLPASLAAGIVTVSAGGVVSSIAAPTGAIVGTSDAQTITNKSISGAEINSGIVGAAFGGSGANLSAAVGILRGGNPFTASELSGDATTSGSNVVTTLKLNGVSYGSGPASNSIPIITASNTATYTGVSACGDATHALGFDTTAHSFTCQSITGSAAAGGSNTQLQYNNSGALAGLADVTFNGTHTVALGASGILDTHLGAFLLPGSLSTGIVTVATSTGVVSSIAAPAGAVVGTSDSQTLTNKSIAGSEINSGLIGSAFGGTGANLSAAAGIVRAGNPFTASELSGDVTTSGSNAATVLKLNGVSFGTSPATDTTVIITAANTATYTAVVNCGDSTHGLAYSTSTHTFSCQSITGSAAAGGSNTQLQYNNSGALGGLPDFTFNGSHTLASGASGILDLHLAAVAGVLLPGALPTGLVRVDTTTGAISSGELTDDVVSFPGFAGATSVSVRRVFGVGFNASPAIDSVPTIVASNSASWVPVPNCGDSTHALSYATSTHLWGCQAISGTTAAGGSATQLQYNNAGALGGIADLTFNGTHTIALTATGILDLHLAPTAGFLLPGALSSGLVTVVTSTGAVSSVAAPAGAVVGTTDSQTLTNKSIAGSEINSGVIASTFGGTGANLSASVGIIRAGNPFTASELSGDVTTSGSNITTALRVNGTTVPVNAAADQVLLTTSSAVGAWKSIGTCTGASKALTYDVSTHTFGCNTISGGGTAFGLAGDIWQTATAGQTTFTPGWAFTGTLMYVFLDGSIMQAGAGNDYQISGNTIVFNYTLFAGQKVRVTQ